MNAAIAQDDEPAHTPDKKRRRLPAHRAFARAFCACPPPGMSKEVINPWNSGSNSFAASGEESWMAMIGRRDVSPGGRGGQHHPRPRQLVSQCAEAKSMVLDISFGNSPINGSSVSNMLLKPPDAICCPTFRTSP